MKINLEISKKINIPIHLFDKYKSIISYMPGTALGVGNIALNKIDKNPNSHEAFILGGKSDGKDETKIYNL